MFKVRLFIDDNGKDNARKKEPDFVFDDVSEPDYGDLITLRMGSEERRYRINNVKKVYDVTDKKAGEIYYDVFLKRDG